MGSFAGLSKFLVIGMSVSLAAGLGVASYFSLYQKGEIFGIAFVSLCCYCALQKCNLIFGVLCAFIGFKFQFSGPLHESHDSLASNEASNKGEDGETVDLSMGSDEISETVEGGSDFDDKNVVLGKFLELN